MKTEKSFEESSNNQKAKSTEDKERHRIFSYDSLVNFGAFGETCQRIHTRLMVEGYTIVDGKIVPPQK